MDDTPVTKVVVVIQDGSGAILLQDYADPSDGSWWNFMTTIAVSNPSAVTISATAYDLPGNTHVLLVDNNWKKLPWSSLFIHRKTLPKPGSLGSFS